MGAAVRYSSATLPNEVIVFLRNGFGLLFLLPWLFKNGLKNLATKRLPEQIFRAFSGLAAMYCFFYAIAHLQLAEAVLLNFSAPLFIPLIAFVWLGESAPSRLVFAIAIGFIGVCLILKPGVMMLKPAAFVGLASAVFAALAMVTIRRLSATEPIIRIVFYFSFVATLVSAFPLMWKWQPPTWDTLIVMALAGFAATVGQLLLTFSYSQAPASQIGPYTYSTVIFAALLGWLFWAEAPDILTVTGAILIGSAGILAMQKKAAPRLE
jgi:drug/metabolite transporter (DMT)-like permease